MKNHLKLFLTFIQFFFLLTFFSSALQAEEKSKIKFSADKMQGSISGDKNSTSLSGNASVTVDTMEIKADRIEIYGKNYRYLKASGNISGEDKEKGFSFTGTFMQYDREKEIALFFGKTYLNDTKNDVKIDSEYIEYNQKAETMLMQFNVKIVQKDIKCESMFAFYNRTMSTLNLTGRPAVTKGSDIFKAAKISVNLDTEDISLEGKVSGDVTEEKEGKGEKKEKKPETPASDESKAPADSGANLSTGAVSGGSVLPSLGAEEKTP